MAFKKVNKLYCFSNFVDKANFILAIESFGLQYEYKSSDCVLILNIPEHKVTELQVMGYYPVW